jgi:hypothetical protein
MGLEKHQELGLNNECTIPDQPEITLTNADALGVCNTTGLIEWGNCELNRPKKWYR